jgi:hypothetical protein
MNKTKIIKTKLNNKYPANFLLQYVNNGDNKKSAILTAPYVKWINAHTHKILNRTYNISDKELECIEKYYFNKNVITIPIKGYFNSVDMQDILEKIVPPNIYNQMLSGTFKLSDFADEQLKLKFKNHIKTNTESFNKKHNFFNKNNNPIKEVYHGRH